LISVDLEYDEFLYVATHNKEGNTILF